MSTVVFKLFTQTNVGDFSCLSLCSVGSIECEFSTVFKFLSLRVAKSDVLGDISVWNPACCGFVTITQGGNINNYAIEFATTVGVGEQLHIYMRTA